MDRSLLNRLLCPACGQGTWALDAAETPLLAYAGGAREEVRTGQLTCACGQVYPIRDFVLSFAALFPAELRHEAAFWDRFYLWNLRHGAIGFHDLRRGFAPFMAQGVPEPFPLADTVDRYDVHYQVAEHPTLRAGRTLLDMGVGPGWTSVHFARAGYEVTAFDPSLGPLQAAKAYAIGEGVFVEYLCAAVGHVAFRPASFDNVVAFHSLHHVPDLEAGLEDVRGWLRPAGGLAIDEHVGNSRLAAALGAELHRWAEANIFPRFRTIPDTELAELPHEGHSALEDAGVNQVVPLIRRLFDVQFERSRHVVLDHYPLLYYLWRDRDLTAYRHALEIANHLQDLLRLVDPEGGDYLTVVATNRPPAAGPTARPATTHAPAALGVPPTEIQDSPAPPDPATLVARNAALEAALAEVDAWAHSLEAAVQSRDRELGALRAHLRRVESGRVMRLMRLLHAFRPWRVTADHGKGPGNRY